MPLQRSMAEIFGAFLDVTKNEIRKCVPATVTAVYPARQTVDVQIATNNIIFDDLGNAMSEPAPSISDVPLGVMRGGGFFVWVPVAVGDGVLVVFSDQSSDTWRSGDGQAHDPGFLGKHTMDSAFAFPMFAPDKKFFADPNNDPTKLILGKDGSQAQIRLSASDIELGASVGDALGLASKINTALSDLAQALNGHVHAVASFGPSGPAGTSASSGIAPPITGATPATTPLGPILDVSSTLVKAQ
jgi:hypothetical protein